MKILVCLTKTPDTTAKIAFKNGNTQFEETGVQWIINPYDEWYALVRAIELKEKDPSTIIHLITVGLADAEPIIRKALALGGDEAIRINIDPKESFQVAGQIAEVVKQAQYDLVLTGKETIDYNGASVGAMLAELIEMPFISSAIKLELSGNNATIRREIEGGEEVNEVVLPAVVACQKGMAEARIPNMRGIMAARSKPLKVVEPATIEPLTTITAFEMPPPKAGVRLVSPENVEELIRLLHDEAKVI